MARSRNRRPSESPKQFKGGENPFGNHSINVKTKSVLEDGLSLGDTRNGSSNLPFQAHRDSDCASEASSRPGEKSLSSHNTSIWETNSSRLGHTFASNKSAVAKRRTMAIGELEILSQELCQVSARNEKDTVGEVEEEELPPTQSSGPLLGVVAYVECYSRAENRSICIANELRQLGAIVSPTFTLRVTHVIFKDGRQATIERARQRNVHIVSVLWVDSCKCNKTRMAESLFSVSPNAEGTPVMVGRIRKQKSMQPKPFDHELAMSAERIVKRQKKFDRVKQLRDLASYGPDSPLEGPDDAILGEPFLLLNDTPESHVYQLKRNNISVSPVEESIAHDSMRLKLDDLREKIMKIANSSPSSLHNRADQSPTSSQALSEAIAKRLFDSKGQVFGSPPPLLHRLVTENRKNANSIEKPETFDRSSESSGDSSSVQSIHQLDQTIKKLVLGSPVNTRRSTKTLESFAGLRERSNLFDAITDSFEDGSHDHEDLTPDLMSPLTPGPSSPPIFVPETQCFERTAKSLSFTAKSIAEIPETVPSEIESEYLSIPQNRFKKKIRHKVSVPNQNCEIPSDNTKKPKSVIPATKNIDQDEHYVAEKLASNKRFLEDEMKRVDQTKKNESKLTIETVVKRKLLNNKCLHRPLSLLVSPNVTDITPVSKKITDRTLQRQEIPKIFGVTTDIRKLEKRPDLKKMIDQIELIPQKKGRKLRSSMFHMQSGSSPINADISRTNSEEDFKPYHYRVRSISRSYDHIEDTSVRAKRKTKKQKPETPEKCIVLTSLHTPERESARKVITRLGGFAIEEKVTERTTHVVSGEPRRTLNILYGLSYGCWIVSLKWLITSAEVESWVAEEQYEMLDEFPAASKHREVKEKNLQRSLFSSIGCIYISDKCNPPARDLKLLIALNGGTVVTIPRKANLFVRYQSAMKSQKSVVEKWVLDCITNNRLLPIGDYLESSYE